MKDINKRENSGKLIIIYTYLIHQNLIKKIMKTGDVNKGNHQLSDTALSYHQILITDIKRTVWVLLYEN